MSATLALVAASAAPVLPGELEWLLELVGRIPVWAIYLVVGLGAAVENVFPPVPSDTFVLLGAFLAEQGTLAPALVLAVAWVGNVSAALAVYGMARRYGRGIFETAWGRWLLRAEQLQRLSAFYERYGLFSIFAVRFLPVLRVVDPVFAGISRLRFWKAALPLGLASAVWYGVLLYVGMLASRNLPRLLGLVEQVNTGLLLGALAVALIVAFWWWRTRRSRESEPEE